MGDLKRTAREEELMIEVERLRAWLYKIQQEAYKETNVVVIEWLAGQSLIRSHCAAHPDWGATEDWATLGIWPPAIIDKPTVAPPEIQADSQGGE